jgi:RNA polymerase-binding transcription factor DksA
MAMPKKPVAKASSAKKPAAEVAKKKPVVGKVATGKALVAAQKSGVATKAAPAKASAPTKKAAPAKKAAPPAKKDIASPTKAAAAAKKAAPSKSAASSTKPATSSSAKKSAPSKAASAAKATPASKGKPAPAPAKKAAVAPAPPPSKKAPASKQAVPEVKVKPDAATKKETKAEQKAALKRTASAVQRVQAKVAAAIPKPQPKPAPMPTVMPGREEKKTNVVIAHRRLESKPKETEDASMTMINYQPDFTRSILDREEKESGPIYRYSDDELAEFKELISNRLATARKELAYQQGLITHKDAAGTEDTENRYMNMEDGSGAMEREQLAQLASRQIQFINHLEKAMIRIENKTYGICRVTGKLIDKARLRAVPHATLSIEAKNTMNK